MYSQTYFFKDEPIHILAKVEEVENRKGNESAIRLEKLQSQQIFVISFLTIILTD